VTCASTQLGSNLAAGDQFVAQPHQPAQHGRIVAGGIDADAGVAPPTEAIENRRRAAFGVIEGWLGCSRTLLTSAQADGVAEAGDDSIFSRPGSGPVAHQFETAAASPADRVRHLRQRRRCCASDSSQSRNATNRQREMATKAGASWLSMIVG